MATYPVKWFSEKQGGVPIPDGLAAGQLIELLDACLITGFNLQSPTGITMTDTVTAKVSFSTDPGYVEHQIILVEGADQAAYNGEHRVTAVAGTDIWVEMDSDPGTAATGTITTKAAPVGGWEMSYVDADRQRAAFRSTDLDATGYHFYFDDRGDGNLEAENSGYASPGATSRAQAFVRGYETFVDPTNRSGEFGEGFLVYSGGDGATYKPESGYIYFDLYADSKRVYFNPMTSLKYYEESRKNYAFGDLKTYRLGDSHHAFLVLSYNQSSYHKDDESCTYLFYVGTANYRYVARPYNQFPITQNIELIALSGVNANQSGVLGSGGGLAFPSRVSNELWLGQTAYAVETLDGSREIRGEYPGFAWSLHSTTPLEDGYTFAKDGRLWQKTTATYTSNNTQFGAIFFDLTGPWG